MDYSMYNGTGSYLAIWVKVYQAMTRKGSSVPKFVKNPEEFLKKALAQYKSLRKFIENEVEPRYEKENFKRWRVTFSCGPVGTWLIGLDLMKLFG